MVLSFPAPSRREGTPSYCYKRARVLWGPSPSLCTHTPLTYTNTSNLQQNAQNLPLSINRERIPIISQDLPSGRCLCNRFSCKVLLVSSKTIGGGPEREVIRAEETIERINRIVKERRLFKPMKEQLRQLPWKLIFILALIQLIRPILSTAGFFDNFRPEGPLIATALIALTWISVVVIGDVREPVKVLAMAGATYAVIGVAMAIFLQTFFTWSPEESVSIPLLLSAGLIGGIVVNVIWGAFLGFVAIGINKAVKR